MSLADDHEFLRKLAVERGWRLRKKAKDDGLPLGRLDYRVPRERELARERLKRIQENSCAICMSTAILVLDHEHSTGRVRGLLCRACNWAVAAHEARGGYAHIEELVRYLAHDVGVS